jgi:hypothetical protein
MIPVCLPARAFEVDPGTGLEVEFGCHESKSERFGLP